MVADREGTGGDDASQEQDHTWSGGEVVEEAVGKCVDGALWTRLFYEAEEMYPAV